MENDVLKNKIAPWQEKGRWYHFVFDYDKNFLTDKTDKFILDNYVIDTSGSGYILIQNPASFTAKKHDILDLKYKLSDDYATSTSGTISYLDYVTSVGRVGKFIYKTATAGSIECWVFIV